MKPVLPTLLVALLTAPVMLVAQPALSQLLAGLDLLKNCRDLRNLPAKP